MFRPLLEYDLILYSPSLRGSERGSGSVGGPSFVMGAMRGLDIILLSFVNSEANEWSPAELTLSRGGDILSGDGSVESAPAACPYLAKNSSSDAFSVSEARSVVGIVDTGL